MESIPREIKLMKQIAEHLKIWFQKHPDDKYYPTDTVPLSLRNGISLKMELKVYLDQVLTWLRVNDHKEIARSLEQERNSFLSDLKAVEQAIKRGDNPPLGLIELRSKITGLMGTLEHTAKVFTDKKSVGKNSKKRRGAGKRDKRVEEQDAGVNGQLDESLMSPEARVLAVFADKPDLNMTSIAKIAKVNRTSLYRMKKFMKVREMRKKEDTESYKNKIPYGEKNGETGIIEAWEK